MNILEIHEVMLKPFPFSNSGPQISIGFLNSTVQEADYQNQQMAYSIGSDRLVDSCTG